MSGSGQIGQRAQYAGGLLVLRTRRLDGTDALDGLRQRGRDPALGLLIPGRALRGATGDGTQQKSQDGGSGEEDGREPPVDQAECDDAADGAGERGQQRRTGRGRGSRLGRVADQARDQVTGAESVCGPRADAQDVPGQPAAQPRRAAGVDGAGEDGLRRVEHDEQQREAGAVQHPAGRRSLRQQKIEGPAECGRQQQSGAGRGGAHQAQGNASGPAVPGGRTQQCAGVSGRRVLVTTRAHRGLSWDGRDPGRPRPRREKAARCRTADAVRDRAGRSPR